MDWIATGVSDTVSIRLWIFMYKILWGITEYRGTDIKIAILQLFIFYKNFNCFF